MYNSDIPSRAELPTSRQLVRSAMLALVTALALLVGVVLPAEYGIDPTGIGRMLQLTEMGEIKIQLANDAYADRVAPANRESSPEQSVAVIAVPAAPARAEPEQPKMAAAEIPASPEVQPNQMVDTTPEPANADPVVKAEPVVPPPPPEPAARVSPPAPAPAAAATPKIKMASPVRKDEMKVVLKPGQGAEIKMQMNQGATTNYAWSITGGVVNFDAHGDGANENAISYEKGRGVGKKEGVMKAAFDGVHGWYWRNRGTADVAVILRTEGEYSGIQRME